jgi:arsenate reductase
MAVKIYVYQKCSTCRDAMKWLDDNGIEYKAVPIRETPPNKRELKTMLKHMDGNLKKLFNTSGMDYRAMNMKEKFPTLTEAQAFDLLNSNGNLVKRPFLLGDDVGIVGFKHAEWKEKLR